MEHNYTESAIFLQVLHLERKGESISARVGALWEGGKVSVSRKRTLCYDIWCVYSHRKLDSFYEESGRRALVNKGSPENTTGLLFTSVGYRELLTKVHFRVTPEKICSFILVQITEIRNF